jgi:site-specific DNA recombinase
MGDAVLALFANRAELARVARESQIHETQVSELLERVESWKGKPLDIVKRVDLGVEEMGLHVDLSTFLGAEGTVVRHVIRACIRRRGVEMRLVLQNVERGACDARIDPALVKAIVRARQWFEQVASGKAQSFAEIARAEGVSRRYVANLIPLAFLAPDIVASILSGTQPVELTTQELTKRVDLPLDWADQRAQLGFD